MLRPTLYATIILMALSLGCQGTRRTGRAPDWVTGPSRHYPKAEFLVAVGSGPSRKIAGKDARAEMARIFKANVDSRVRTYRKYFQVRGSGENADADEFSLNNLTTVSTNFVLEGSEIAEVHRQKEPEEFYALAVLDRAKTGRILRDRILRLDDEIETVLGKASGSQENLAKLRYLKRSLPKFVMRDALESQLRIVDRAGGGVLGRANGEEVKSQVDKLLSKEVAIGVKVTGSGSGEIRASVLKELTALDLPVAAHTVGREFDLSLDISSSFSASKRGKDFYDTRWEVKSRLLDRSGKEIKVLVKEVSGGYVDRSQAERLSLAEVKQKIPAALAKQVDDYLMGR